MGEVSVMVFLDYSLVGAGVGVEGNDRIGENAEFGLVLLLQRRSARSKEFPQKICARGRP